MSKRNKQQSMYQPAGQSKRRTTGKTNGKTNIKPVRSSGSGTRAYTRSAPPLPKAANQWNLRIVRITAIIIAVVAIVGGIAWASSIRNGLGSFTPIQIVGLIALGFTAGLAIAVAFRTDEIVARVIKMRRDRQNR
jgi:hypothetical protein